MTTAKAASAAPATQSSVAGLTFRDLPTDGDDFTDYDWKEAFREAGQEPSTVAAVVRWWYDTGDYAEMDLAVVFLLVSGRYAAMTAWCDTTGWDCRAGAEWYEADTEAELVRTRLTQRERRALLYEATPEDPHAKGDAVAGGTA